MNKLKTFNDGSYMPVWQSDLEFIQNAFHAPFEQLCETLLGRTSGIITGCQVSQTHGYTNITEGLVLMEGKIVRVPAQSVAGTANAVQMRSDYDPVGDKVFKINDGTEVRQTYYTPWAELILNISGGIHDVTLILDDDGKKTLIQLLFERLYGMALQMPYNIITSSGVSGLDVYSIKYARIGKRVFILELSGHTGGYDPGGGDGSIHYGTLLTLPVEFRPAVETFFAYKIKSCR